MQKTKTKGKTLQEKQIAPSQTITANLLGTGKRKTHRRKRQIDSIALQQSLRHLDTAYQNFFRDKKIGFPKFKSKKNSHKSYTTIGKGLIKIDKWFPSSKTCSACGAIKKSLTLSERSYVCDCGAILDRDINAAINIKYVRATINNLKPWDTWA